MNSGKVPEFNELQHRIFALFYETSDLLLKCEDATYGEFGLSQQKFLVLMAIESSSTPHVKIIDVARKLKRNSNSISMIVDRMERDGLVERVRDVVDRRSVHLSLTKVGKEKLYQGSKVGWSLMVRLMACLSVEEMESLSTLLEKIRVKASEELNPDKPVSEIEKPDAKVVKRMLKGA